MFSDMSIFKVYSALAQHAAESQRVNASNIARSGEPGYKAQEVEAFGDYLARMQLEGKSRAASDGPKIRLSDSPASPNGNTVNLEQEIFKSAEALGQHNMALTVYTKSLDLMRSALGRR